MSIRLLKDSRYLFVKLAVLLHRLRLLQMQA